MLIKGSGSREAASLRGPSHVSWQRRIRLRGAARLLEIPLRRWRLQNLGIRAGISASQPIGAAGRPAGYPCTPHPPSPPIPTCVGSDRRLTLPSLRTEPLLPPLHAPASLPDPSQTCKFETFFGPPPTVLRTGGGKCARKRGSNKSHSVVYLVVSLSRSALGNVYCAVF